MPIRFRCAYCNQLMGIAKRKAGSVIRCPKCAGQVIVPNPELENRPAPAPALQPFVAPPPGPINPAPALFEGSDFDQVFSLPATAGPAPSPRPSAPIPSFVPPSPPMALDVEPIVGPLAGPGIFLTPAKLTFVSVLIVILLGLAFFFGLLVGRS